MPHPQANVLHVSPLQHELLERMVVERQQIGIGLFTAPLRKRFPNSDNKIDQRHAWLPDRVLDWCDLMT